MPRTGDTVALSLTVSRGSDPVAPDPGGIQWFFNGAALPGQKGRVLTLSGVSRSHAGAYLVEVRVDGQSWVAGPYYLEPVDKTRLVTDPGDQGPGTLRAQMLAAAQETGTQGIRIALPPEAGPIRLQTALPKVTTPLVILGRQESRVTVDGGGVCRPFLVDTGGDLVLSHFLVSGGLGKGGDGLGGGGGAPGMGGALFVNDGHVLLRHMAFMNNRAQGGASFPGSDGENGGGGGFGGDSPSTGGAGASGGVLGGIGGFGVLDGVQTTDTGGEPGDGVGAGGGAARGGLLDTPLDQWAPDLGGGNGGDFCGGGGFGVGPSGGGGDGSFGSGGGGSGGIVTLAGATQALVFPGADGGAGGTFGGDGGLGNGLTGGVGGGGGGLGGAVFVRRGALDMDACSFEGNRAEGGQGSERGLGKGGAVFIFEHADDPVSMGRILGMLQAQHYAGNAATDLVEDPSFDNSNFYVAQTYLGKRVDPAFRDLYRRYRLALRMGIPPRGTP